MRTEYINLGGDTASLLITMMLCAYVYDGDHQAIELARSFVDSDGNSPPVDDMVSMMLCEDGRLLTDGKGTGIR